MKKIKRVDAIKAGLNRYFTGIKCYRGHLSERRVGNGACVKCGEQDWRDIYSVKYKNRRRVDVENEGNQNVAKNNP